VTSRRGTASVAAACVLLSSLASGQTTSPAAESTELQPKPIWGLLIQYVAGEVFAAFSQWARVKMSDSPPSALASAQTPQLAADELRRKLDTTGGAIIMSNAGAAAAALGDTAPTTFEAPSTPIKVDQGAANYQGVHVAIVGVDRAGVITELRAVKDGFRTGERFKLRAISTFGGLLVIHNINPKGDHRQIYPPRPGDVVVLQPGADTLLPLGSDEFFEFARATGEEQLVISLRDARAIGAAASRTRVHRKDEDYGTHFVQQVSADKFAVISEGIRLQHY
jgi:hypothetical protein